jgi:hypothetical protein
MKNLICILISFVSIYCISCNYSKKETNEFPLQGAWETFYIKQVFPDTTIVRTSLGKNPQVHIFTKKHFAFGWQTSQNTYSAGGGEYTFDGDSLKMLSKYHWYSSLVGITLNYKVTIVGDTLTRIGLYKSDTLNVEVLDKWKRIE